MSTLTLIFGAKRRKIFWLFRKNWKDFLNRAWGGKTFSTLWYYLIRKQLKSKQVVENIYIPCLPLLRLDWIFLLPPLLALGGVKKIFPNPGGFFTPSGGVKKNTAEYQLHVWHFSWLFHCFEYSVRNVFSLLGLNNGVFERNFTRNGPIFSTFYMFRGILIVNFLPYKVSFIVQ